MVDDDQLSGVTVGDVPQAAAGLSVERLPFDEWPLSEKVPGIVAAWQYFEGALMSVVLGYPSPSRVLGTAVMIAPGLAITAEHVVEDVRGSSSDASLTPTISCVAPRSERLDLWEVCRLMLSDVGDWARPSPWPTC